MTEERNTVFKSCYYYNQYQMELFVNLNEETGEVSFVVKRGKYFFVYNCRPDERIPLLKAMLKGLTVEEKSVLRAYLG